MQTIGSHCLMPLPPSKHGKVRVRGEQQGNSVSQADISRSTISPNQSKTLSKHSSPSLQALTPRPMLAPKDTAHLCIPLFSAHRWHLPWVCPETQLPCIISCHRQGLISTGKFPEHRQLKGQNPYSQAENSVIIGSCNSPGGKRPWKVTSPSSCVGKAAWRRLASTQPTTILIASSDGTLLSPWGGCFSPLAKW